MRAGRDLLPGAKREPAPPCCACDREPGAVRLAAVEPKVADGLMLLLVEARCRYNSIPGSYHRAEEKGVWHRPATDTSAHRLPLVRRSSGSLVRLIQVMPYGCTVVLCAGMLTH